MTTWSMSSDEIASSYVHTSGALTASWYSIESEEYGFIFWEGFDDLDWDEMGIQDSEYGGQSKWEELGQKVFC